MDKKVIDKHHIKGLVWDILIDLYMPDKIHYSLEEVERLLKKIEVIMNKLDKINIFEFIKVLLKELERMTDTEKVDFEEVFLPK
jgi:hypothetical protein